MNTEIDVEKIRKLLEKEIRCTTDNAPLKKILSLLPPPCSECGGSGEVPERDYIAYCGYCACPGKCHKKDIMEKHWIKGGYTFKCPICAKLFYREKLINWPKMPCPACQAPNVMDYTVPKGFLLVKSDSFMGKIYDDFIKWLEKKDKHQNGTGQAPAGIIEEFVKALKKDAAYDRKIGLVEISITLFNQACTHLEGLLKQIEQLEGENKKWQAKIEERNAWYDRAIVAIERCNKAESKIEQLEAENQKEKE